MPGINRDVPQLIYFDGSPEGLVDAPFNTVCMDELSPTIYRKTTQSGTSCGWVLISASTFKLMATGDIRMMVEQTNGQLQEKVITKGSSMVLGTDSNGNLQLTALPPTPKAGVIALAPGDTNAGTKSVVFTAAYPTGTTYNIYIHFNGIAMVYTIATSPAPTVTGFTFSYLATLSGNAYWSTDPITG